MPSSSVGSNLKVVPNSANLSFAAPRKDTVLVLVNLLPPFVPKAASVPITGTDTFSFFLYLMSTRQSAQIFIYSTAPVVNTNLFESSVIKGSVFSSTLDAFVAWRFVVAAVSTAISSLPINVISPVCSFTS